MPKIRTGPARGDGAGALLPALRERIARHALPPGAKLLENDLAREFGVSRAKVRDAFGVLEQRGLIQRIPNRGAVVARLDLSQVFEIYAVREMLEGLCVRLAVERTRPSSWQDLVQVFGRPMETIVKRFPVSREIADALLTRSGFYGDMLKLAEYLEHLKEAGPLVPPLLEKLQLSADELYELELDAYGWSDTVCATQADVEHTAIGDDSRA